MAGQLNTYSQEIFNFLRTVTIKFTPFAYNMGESYMNAHGLASPDFEENPYYQTLVGNYSDTDTRMMVTTVEDGSLVEYNRTLIETYPQTAALYRIPNKEYFTLEEKYPENIGLIRTIAYPVVDIETAIAAPNLSLLAYDDSLLETNEREDLITCLKDFLKMVRTRWWVDAYVYEELYPVVFWSILWQQLPLLLLSRRFKNIKTPYVHSYHIWEYLQSKGLSDYRDVLTNKQATWLYRNIDYIHANRGKNDTLKILAENLLPDVAVSLLYKDMYQETETRYEDELSTNPIFRSYQLTNDNHVKDETFTELNDKLVELGVEHRNDAEYVNDQELLLARHKYNILNTKFLEFKKEPVDTRSERLMVNFFLDTLFYRLSKGKLLYECKFNDPLTTVEYKLSISDTLLLWHYAIWMSQGITPVKIPSRAICWIPFKLTYPGDNNISQYSYTSGSRYRLSSLLDLPWLKTHIPWSDKSFGLAEDFMKNTVQQFAALLQIKELVEQSHRKEYHDAMMLYLHDVRDSCVVTLNLTSASNFEVWGQKEELAPLIEAYRDITDPQDLELYYGKLAKTCFDALLPTANLDLEQFVGSTRSMENVYRAIRDLFIQLGSYNVFYLETERDRNEYITFYEPDISFPLSMDMEMDDIFSWTHENYLLNVNYHITPKIEDLSADVGMSDIIPDITITGEIGHDANITDITLIFKPTFTTPVSNELTNFEFEWVCDIVPLISDQQSINLRDK